MEIPASVFQNEIQILFDYKLLNYTVDNFSEIFEKSKFVWAVFEIFNFVFFGLKVYGNLFKRYYKGPWWFANCSH